MLLDEKILLQSCGGDEEFARELFGEYHQRVQELFAIMRQALEANRCEEIRKSAHELKGSSLTLGAVSMAGLSRTLEDQLKAGEAVNLAEMLVQLETQSDLLFQHLKSMGYLSS